MCKMNRVTYTIRYQTRSFPSNYRHSNSWKPSKTPALPRRSLFERIHPKNHRGSYYLKESLAFTYQLNYKEDRLESQQCC